jgi:hypothetical protein
VQRDAVPEIRQDLDALVSSAPEEVRNAMEAFAEAYPSGSSAQLRARDAIYDYRRDECETAQ